MQHSNSLEGMRVSPVPDQKKTSTHINVLIQCLEFVRSSFNMRKLGNKTGAWGSKELAEITFEEYSVLQFAHL